jgi:hypothetical protein
MNINESYYIYKYEQTKELLEEPKSKKEKENNQSLLFEIAIGAGTYTHRNDVGDRRV